MPDCAGKEIRAGFSTVSIMAQVAVFDMNMEKAKVTLMRAGRSRLGRPRVRRRTLAAIWRSRRVRLAARARTSPPKNSHMGGLAQGLTNFSQACGSSAAARTPPG